MNWNLGFFDADTVRRAAIAAGLGTGASALFPEEAEGAVRSDIFDVVKKSIERVKALPEKKENFPSYAGKSMGTLEGKNAVTSLQNSTKYNGNRGYATEHGLTWRHEQDNWTTEQIADAYKGIYDSPDTVVIPNVLGRNPTAKEALWNPNGINGHSWYMPIVPYKKGFKGVTLYDPETSRVEKELKERGYWEGGSTSSIFTPTLGERSESIGSGTLSAVNSGPFLTKTGMARREAYYPSFLARKMPLVRSGCHFLLSRHCQP